MPKFSEASRKKLETCHPDIQRVMNEVIKFFDITVLCGHRTEEEQNKAFPKHSKKKWPNSEHNTLPSNAIDIAPYPIQWPDMKEQTMLVYVKRLGRFYRMAGIVQGVAYMMGIKLKWGGDFKSFFDGPHFQLVHDE
jgi:peptidoglycan L-alanyl-D-glutamate endopeptidase CwlK